MSAENKSFPYLLVVSLCVNALMVGAMAGIWMSTSRTESNPAPEVKRDVMLGGPLEERIARTAMYDLPEDERARFREGLSQEWRDTRALREQMDRVRERIADELASDDYSPEEMQSAFADLREGEMAFKTRLHDRLADFLAMIPDEKRKTILQRSMDRRDRYGGHRDRRGPPPERMGPDGPDSRERSPQADKDED